MSIFLYHSIFIYKNKRSNALVNRQPLLYFNFLKVITCDRFHFLQNFLHSISNVNSNYDWNDPKIKCHQVSPFTFASTYDSKHYLPGILNVLLVFYTRIYTHRYPFFVWITFCTINSHLYFLEIRFIVFWFIYSFHHIE